MTSPSPSKALSRGELEHNCRYNISKSIPGWSKAPDKELGKHHFVISDRSRFVTVSTRGIRSHEKLRKALDEFDMDEAYSRAMRSEPDVLSLEELVEKEN